MTPSPIRLWFLPASLAALLVTPQTQTGAEALTPDGATGGAPSSPGGPAPGSPRDGNPRDGNPGDAAPQDRNGPAGKPHDGNPGGDTAGGSSPESRDPEAAEDAPRDAGEREKS